MMDIAKVAGSKTSSSFFSTDKSSNKSSFEWFMKDDVSKESSMDNPINLVDGLKKISENEGDALSALKNNSLQDSLFYMNNLALEAKAVSKISSACVAAFNDIVKMSI